MSALGDPGDPDRSDEGSPRGQVNDSLGKHAKLAFYFVTSAAACMRLLSCISRGDTPNDYVYPSLSFFNFIWGRAAL